ncbi:hypothetical protein BGZ74_004594 [Mortierella antarctica]|nr:hypothetical protein BGZ74_004594 [Mortierella antarctica]
MMSKSNIAYHHFAAAAATIASPLPSPAMALNDGANPWANIGTAPSNSTTSSTTSTSTSTMSPSTSATLSQPSSGAKDQLATPSVVYSNSTQPTLVSIMDGAIQPKNVINDVFLSSTMLCDDVELYLNESSSSNFDSDSDSGFSTPSTHDDDSHFSTPMTPMSPFMENDDEDLYRHEGEDEQPEEELQDNKQASSSIDLADMVVDMKRPMFIPVSICDPRDFAAMASLPTPPECNARKHSYDFLRNSDAFMLGGISSTKRRRVLSVDMMSSSEAPASPPASNAGDDELELSDADSSASSYMARRRSLFQMRNVRHLTPTSPSMPEIFCFAPPTHEEYDYHPELDHSDDEDEEEEEEDDEDDRVENTRMMEHSMVSSYVRDVVASGLFVVEDQAADHISYMSDDNYSSSDDEGEVGYHSEDEMHVDDAMSSSDESDSDLSDVEEYQFPVRRRGTWHGPSLEALEAAAAAEEGKAFVAPKPETRPSHKTNKKKDESKKQESKTKTKAESTPAPAAPAPVASPASKKSSTSCEVKSTKTPTLFQILTKANIDWCRYCGTTEGVNWRPGPWGKRTLCNKHGCDFKGYGFACKLPRLDLTSYAHETVDQRIRPVLQHFCHGCQSQESAPGNVMIRCEGCPKAFHQKCHGETPISDEVASSDKAWFCDDNCRENVKKRRVCVELPKKRLPLMSTPKPATGSAAGTAEPSTPSSPARPRVRASISGESPSRAK